MSIKNNTAQPWFTSGDLDGFFGLAVDNLIQFLLIAGLCIGVLGFDMSLVIQTVLPGAALSILLGNLFYAYQSQKLSALTGRKDVTALPYGINTVSLFAFVFLVMLPVKLEALAQDYTASEAALIAWRTGLAACFLSGIIEFAGSFVAERIRRATPRAALLSTLAGIAISFIAIDFAIRTFKMPLVAFLPLAVILATYFGRVKMPLKIPGGAWAVILGTVVAWVMTLIPDVNSPVSSEAFDSAFSEIGFYFPMPLISDLMIGLTHPLTLQFFIPVILPMGLFNVLGSLQNIESAEAAGDKYSAGSSLAVNGAGSILASLFGSCFPTTIYIGHPGWKLLGARSGYSILNGAFFLIISLFGLTALINAVVPIEAGMGIVLWIGITITAQAFQAVRPSHAPAVALGLFPAIAAWGVLMVTQTLGAVNFATGDFGMAEKVLSSVGSFSSSGLEITGLVALSQGFMLTCMLWSATCVSIIESKFSSAAVWMSIGGALAFFGFIHVGELGPSGGVFHIGFASGWNWAIAYVLCAGFFWLCNFMKTQKA